MGGEGSSEAAMTRHGGSTKACQGGRERDTSSYSAAAGALHSIQLACHHNQHCTCALRQRGSKWPSTSNVKRRVLFHEQTSVAASTDLEDLFPAPQQHNGLHHLAMVSKQSVALQNLQCKTPAPHGWNGGGGGGGRERMTTLLSTVSRQYQALGHV
jgi:hypothetical protein